MNTDDLVQIALDLVGFARLPADSAIYVPGEGLHKVLFGLDIGTAELVLARQLGYDAVIAHHPVGVPHRHWPVYERHVELMVAAGVPEEAARAAVAPRLEALRVAGQARNYEQVSEAARLLGMPFLNIHCPLDELGRRVLQETVDAVLVEKPQGTLDDLVWALAALPAARRAETEVQVLLGHPEAPAGRTHVAHGALTNGGYDVAQACYEHGLDTVVYIHIAYADLLRLREAGRGQLIVTGHLVGDAVGIEPYIAALRRQGLRVDVLSQIFA
ncbi:MAG: hypothetical protein JXA37_13945 [Chloroflexia bacterium]|nr:hypothetical protein [Chloroflexia bacterium]